MLDSLAEPIRGCESSECVTGSPECGTSLCTFLVDGLIQTGGLLVDYSTNVGVLLMGACPPPMVVAIGGGGGVDTGADNSGGGGSGHVEWVDLNQTSYTEVVATVGSARQPSVVTSKMDNSPLVTAQCGEDAWPYGGDGYRDRTQSWLKCLFLGYMYH